MKEIRQVLKSECSSHCASPPRLNYNQIDCRGGPHQVFFLGAKVDFKDYAPGDMSNKSGMNLGTVGAIQFMSIHNFYMIFSSSTILIHFKNRVAFISWREVAFFRMSGIV